MTAESTRPSRSSGLCLALAWHGVSLILKVGTGCRKSSRINRQKPDGNPKPAQMF
jgi:hypothetical protein